jgi:flagellar biosynthesis protein FliQ
LWHLTLPVSARRQWFIKLCTALFAGFVGAGLVPFFIAGRLLGSPADVHVGRVLLVVAVLLTFAAFWCACAVKGTVPAVLWTLPVLIAVCCAVELGKWAGPALANLFLSRFDPFTNVKFAHALSRFSSNAFFKLIDSASTNMTDSVQAALVLTTIILVPTLLYAVIQSYRLFRAQLQDRALSVVRRLLPLAVLAFLCGFFSLAFYTFVGRAAWAAVDPRWIALPETIGALQKIQSGIAKPDAAHPLELTVEDLAKASPLSKSTRRLLGDSHITLVLDAPPHHGHFGCVENPLPFGRFVRGDSWSSAIIRLDGSSFVVAFDPVTHSPVSVGLCAGQPPPPPEGGVVRVPR